MLHSLLLLLNCGLFFWELHLAQIVTCMIYDENHSFIAVAVADGGGGGGGVLVVRVSNASLPSVRAQLWIIVLGVAFGPNCDLHDL